MSPERSPAEPAAPSETSPPPRSAADIAENTRIGYQVTGNLMIFEGNLIWARSNSFLVAHTLIVAAATLNTSAKEPALSFGLPVAGFIFCLVWGAVSKRGADYFAYWIRSMRELEEKGLAPEVRTISRGAAFAAGHPVSFGGQVPPQRMSNLGRRLRIISSTYLLIAVFMALYLLLFISAF
jgi:hypothetical protein